MIAGVAFADAARNCAVFAVAAPKERSPRMVVIPNRRMNIASTTSMIVKPSRARAAV